MINIGIFGSSGYTGGELIRILLRHPNVSIKSLISFTKVGKPIHSIHRDLLGDTNLLFTKNLDLSVELIFICLGHGYSKKVLKKISKIISVIDLSNDFRLYKNSFVEERKFIYGLPEFQINTIKKSKNIANPGCFATAIELALLPLAKLKILKENIHISAITGSTGAGQSLNEKVHFTWRSHNISSYNIFIHQHLNEIRETLLSLQPNFSGKIFFVPYRGNFTRGILTTIYTKCNLSLKEIKIIYEDFYKIHPFVFISDDPLDIKQVLNTNKCLIYLNKEKKYLIINSTLDNLLKGASGQAVQNFNLMYGYNQTTGLQFKSVAF